MHEVFSVVKILKRCTFKFDQPLTVAVMYSWLEDICTNRTKVTPTPQIRHPLEMGSETCVQLSKNFVQSLLSNDCTAREGAYVYPLPDGYNSILGLLRLPASLIKWGCRFSIGWHSRLPVLRSIALHRPFEFRHRLCRRPSAIVAALSYRAHCTGKVTVHEPVCIFRIGVRHTIVSPSEAYRKLDLPSLGARTYYDRRYVGTTKFRPSAYAADTLENLGQNLRKLAGVGPP